MLKSRAAKLFCSLLLLCRLVAQSAVYMIITLTAVGVQVTTLTSTIYTTNLYTDEASAYARVAKTGRGHGSVCQPTLP